MNEQHGFGPSATTMTRPARRQPAPSTGHYAGLHGEDLATTPTDSFPPTRYTRSDFAEVEEPRSTTSVRRYAPGQTSSRQTAVRVTYHGGVAPSAIPQRASKTTGARTAKPVHTPYEQHDAVMTSPPRTTHRTHTRLSPRFLLVFLLFMVTLMLVGWMLISLALHWWQTVQNDWHYGHPRTSQIDAVVGHVDSTAHPSHFIAVNLSGHIVIFEMQGGDPSKSKIYVGPTITGADADLAPVVLQFRDVTGDHQPDLIIELPDANEEYVLVNDHNTFRSPRPNEVTGQ